ncbi:hypothetical protein GQ457_01G016980 [Hibiscus cannabinus]
MANTSLSANPSASSSSAQVANSDVIQFVTVENHDCYNKEIKDITIWEEQGFHFEENTSNYGLEPFLYNKLQHQGWFQFSCQPVRENIDWVREFYAHNHNVTNPYVYVCGRPIPSHTVSINKFFHLSNEEESIYELIKILGREDYDVIKDQLCELGTK